MKNLMKKKNDKEIISENEDWFTFFNVFPYVITIFFAAVCFVLGIVFAAVFKGYFLPVFWFGGAAFCAINYAVLKIVLSYCILQIYYLKKIASSSNSEDEQEQDDADELSEI